MRCSSNLLLAAFLVIVLDCTAATEKQSSNCEAAETCNACLNTGGECKWCVDEDYQKDSLIKPRCNTLAKLKQEKCKDIQIKDGKVTKTGLAFGTGTQLIPKNVELILRPGQTQSFTLSVKPEENYPVRLYYLMDMSRSMEDDLANLKKLGTQIANKIKDITNDFQLAFGTFVDKPMSPYKWLTKDRSGTRLPTFGYKHVFNFNADAQMFQRAVGKQRNSGNLDSPEGGFDALMQVAVCGDKIWPKEGYSRKIVVFLTDATPHIAGDGLLAGITIPNDGECHLDANMTYSKTTDMDYPSVSFLKYKLKENGIIPIIAATKMVEPTYRKLTNEWKDLGTLFGILDSDSGNIVQLIKDNYETISRTIRLSDDSSEDLEVKYKVASGCDKDKTTRDNECTEVEINQKVDFEVSVTAINCPAGHKKGQNFSVTAPGFGGVKVNVKYICDCDCDLKVGDLNSVKCNGTGTFKCGMCYCDEGRFGRQCQCDSEAQEDDTLCMRPNSTDTEICSGLGSCLCGECVCNELSDKTKKISGTYCQCNNYGCDRFNGKICGGEERGVCKCGKCVCRGAYLGDDCGEKNCTAGRRECIKNGVVCSGNGKCNCDTCECEYGYTGQYCETCSFCPDKCKNDGKCVLCHEPYKIGEKSFCDKCDLQIEVVNVTQYGDIKCSVRVNESCLVYFSYNITNGITYLEKEEVCKVIRPKDPPILAIVLGIIGGILLIALLLLLLWKLLVTVHDQNEYKRFMENVKDAPKSDQNPLYVTPQQQVNNPTYIGHRQ